MLQIVQYHIIGLITNRTESDAYRGVLRGPVIEGLIHRSTCKSVRLPDTVCVISDIT